MANLQAKRSCAGRCEKEGIIGLFRFVALIRISKIVQYLFELLEAFLD